MESFVRWIIGLRESPDWVAGGAWHIELQSLPTGMWAGLKELRNAWRPGKQFKPKMKEDVRAAHLARWQSAVQRA